MAPLVAFALVSSARDAQPQSAELSVRQQTFFEPSGSSEMMVLTPAAALTIVPSDEFNVAGSYTADIVSGASEAVKAGPQFVDTPDIVSTASVTDLRHVAGGTVTWHRPETRLSAGYTYGIERDYRSHAVTASAGADFFQRNTELEVAYSHGFDQVCDNALNANQAPTARIPLDDANGCFEDEPDRRTIDVSLDNVQAAWTQAWTPVLATQVVFTGSLLSGFLANPYRAVVIGSSGESAQEHHPDHRNRWALAVRGKYFLKGLDTAVGVGVRAYRDTWDILAQTYEADLETNMTEWLRFRIRGRFYAQSGSIFWSDDYSGGEPATGARGQYWSGDRELSPLKSVLAGGTLTTGWSGAPGRRVLGLFIDAEAYAGLDLLKTFLEDFTLAGRDPDDTLAFIGAAGITASF